TSSGGDVFAEMPDEVTLQLPRGIAVGGTVQDERGRPVQGARILLTGSGYRGFTMNTTERLKHEYSDLHKLDVTSPAATTDARGRWTFRHFPAELDRLELTVVRPDDARETYSTQDDGLNLRPGIAVADLKAQ